MQGREYECGAMIFMDIDCLDFVQLTNNDDLRGVVTKVKAIQKGRKKPPQEVTNELREMPTKLSNKLLDDFS